MIGFNICARTNIAAIAATFSPSSRDLKKEEIPFVKFLSESDFPKWE